MSTSTSEATMSDASPYPDSSVSEGEDASSDDTIQRQTEIVASVRLQASQATWNQMLPDGWHRTAPTGDFRSQLRREGLERPAQTRIFDCPRPPIANRRTFEKNYVPERGAPVRMSTWNLPTYEVLTEERERIAAEQQEVEATAAVERERIAAEREYLRLYYLENRLIGPKQPIVTFENLIQQRETVGRLSRSNYNVVERGAIERNRDAVAEELVLVGDHHLWTEQAARLGRAFVFNTLHFNTLQLAGVRRHRFTTIEDQIQPLETRLSRSALMLVGVTIRSLLWGSVRTYNEAHDAYHRAAAAAGEQYQTILLHRHAYPTASQYLRWTEQLNNAREAREAEFAPRVEDISQAFQARTYGGNEEIEPVPPALPVRDERLLTEIAIPVEEAENPATHFSFGARVVPSGSSVGATTVQPPPASDTPTAPADSVEENKGEIASQAKEVKMGEALAVEPDGKLKLLAGIAGEIFTSLQDSTAAQTVGADEDESIKPVLPEVKTVTLPQNSQQQPSADPSTVPGRTQQKKSTLIETLMSKPEFPERVRDFISVHINCFKDRSLVTKLCRLNFGMRLFPKQTEPMKKMAASSVGKAVSELLEFITPLLADDSRDPKDDSPADKILADILWNSYNGAPLVLENLISPSTKPASDVDTISPADAPTQKTTGPTDATVNPSKDVSTLFDELREMNTEAEVQAMQDALVDKEFDAIIKELFRDHGGFCHIPDLVYEHCKNSCEMIMCTSSMRKPTAKMEANAKKKVGKLLCKAIEIILRSIQDPEDCLEEASDIALAGILLAHILVRPPEEDPYLGARPRDNRRLSGDTTESEDLKDSFPSETGKAQPSESTISSPPLKNRLRSSVSEETGVGGQNKSNTSPSCSQAVPAVLKMPTNPAAIKAPRKKRITAVVRKSIMKETKANTPDDAARAKRIAERTKRIAAAESQAKRNETAAANLRRSTEANATAKAKAKRKFTTGPERTSLPTRSTQEAKITGKVGSKIPAAKTTSGPKRKKLAGINRSSTAQIGSRVQFTLPTQQLGLPGRTSGSKSKTETSILPPKKKARLSDKTKKSLVPTALDNLELFKPSRIVKKEYWEHISLIAPCKDLPNGQSKWAAADARFFYCFLCRDKYNFSPGNSNQIARHLETPEHVSKVNSDTSE
jgi:hypothetical protein